MAKLETQINQIFINPTESRRVSFILFEEKLSANQHLYFIAELKDIQKKTELNDLSKISELIIDSFRGNKKTAGEAMFENTLAEINHKLGEFAHKGRKSWLGKFSALIALRNDKDIYLANTGHTSAWLKRKNNLNEILSPDKAETHPLKTFLNFSSGRLAENDYLVLTTTSLFNYISVELFSRTLNSYNLQDSCAKISEILKSSARSDEGFAVFMLELTKQAALAPSPVVEEKETILPSVAPPAPAKSKKGKTKSAPQIPGIEPVSPIYAPMPEDLYQEEVSASVAEKTKLPALPKISWKLPKPSLKFNFNFPTFGFLPNISGPAKFFLISFIVFAVLFAMNIAAFGVRKAQIKAQETFNASAQVFVDYLAEAESSLLYKNQNQAMQFMSSAETELVKLAQLNAAKAEPFRAKFEEMNNKVNRVTVLRNLTPIIELSYPVTVMARAGSGYLVSNENPNSLGMYNENTLTNLFMLNTTDGVIRGISHVSGEGNYVVSRDKIYQANQQSKEFEQMHYISNGDLYGLKFTDPNRIYTLNKASNQVVRLTVASNGKVSAPTNILKQDVSLADARDFAVDNDVYILFPDRLAKFANGNQVNFQLAEIYEPLSNLTRIRIGNQIYLLEPITKRVLIYSRQGELLNQVQFPELTELNDLYVDEAAREMHLLNGNKIYRITF